MTGHRFRLLRGRPFSHPTELPRGSGSADGEPIGFLPSEAEQLIVLANKKQMPEGNFRQVCPRIGSLRGEGLRHLAVYVSPKK